MSLRSIVVVASTLSVIVCSGVAHSQDTQTGQPPAVSGALEEIVVTANKRSENLENVPISIEVVTAADFKASGITSTEDLGMRVAGLNFQTGNLNFDPYIRGVGTTATNVAADNSVQIYVDGVLITSFTGGLEALNNIQQIEVDKGPQGTLFGRNTTGGVINITTRQPTQDFHADTSVSYGNYDTISSSDYVSGGILPDLAADVAVYYTDQGDGWGHNLHTGSDIDKSNTKAARSKWVWTPTSADKVSFSADYQDLFSSIFGTQTIVPGTYSNWGPGPTTAAQRADMAAGVANGSIYPGFVAGSPFPHTGDTYDINAAVNPYAHWWQYGESLKWQHDFGFAQGVSISAYRTYREDLEWSANPIPSDQQIAGWGNGTYAFTQEVQLLSAESSAIKWVLGAFYLNDTVRYVRPFFIEGTSISGVTAPGAPFSRINFLGEQGTRSIAGYGQATVPLRFIDDATDVTAGIRYTRDEKDIAGSIFFNVATSGAPYLGFLPPAGPTVPAGSTNGSDTWNKVTYRVAFDHHFTQDVLGYVSYNVGFKSGGYNMIPPSSQAYQPEILDAWEVGLKNELLDHRLRINAAAFLYNWSDLQVTVFENTSAVTVNAAKAKLYGLDLDTQFKVTDSLTLSGGLEYLKDYFVSYPDATYSIQQTAAEGGGTVAESESAAGNPLPYAPSFTLNAVADYTVPLPQGALDANVTYYYSSGFRTTADDLLGQRHYQLVNVAAGYTLPDTRTRFSVWAKNLSNQVYASQMYTGNNPGGYDAQVLAAPRTYGVSAEYKF